MKGEEPGVDLETALDMAEAALRRGESDTTLEICQKVLSTFGEHPGALFLAAEALRDQRELDAAEEYYRRVTQIQPDHAPSWAGLAAVLFDNLQFDEAYPCVSRAIRLDDTLPDAYWWRGLLRERRGDYPGANRDLRRAHLIDPTFPKRVPLDDATLEAVVEECVRALHPSIQEYLKQVTVLAEEVPEEDVLAGWDPPMPPSEILGYFTGNSLMDRSLEDPWSNLPSAIILYRRNIERIAEDREKMLEELRITFMHEVGHYLGLDEDDLADRGLD